MIALLASAALDVLDLIMSSGMTFLVVWALWTDQLRGGSKKAAFALCCLGSVAFIMRLCGVRP